MRTEAKKPKNCGCGQDPCVTYGNKELTQVQKVDELFGAMGAAATKTKGSSKPENVTFGGNNQRKRKGPVPDTKMKDYKGSSSYQKMMAKEEVEVQERTLDTFEKGEKERIVKGMKKDTKDLKKRYGKKWKNVMYATATKKAKEEGDTTKSDKRYAYEETDRAFASVVASLRAKHGKDAVITKDNPIKPPTEAQKKEYAAHKAKIAAQDTRDDSEKSSQGRYSRKYSNRGSD